MPRTKGAKDLSGQEKAQIIAQKNTKLYNHQKIADNFNISKTTVDHLSERRLPLEIQQLARQYESEYVQYIEAGAMKAVKHVLSTIEELSADKAAVVAEKFFNISQIHHNRPTKISREISEVELARQLLTRLIEKRGWTEHEAIAGIKERFPALDIKLLKD